MANDTLVEIAFDNRGTKKIMANYTKIKRYKDNKIERSAGRFVSPCGSFAI